MLTYRCCLIQWHWVASIYFSPFPVGKARRCRCHSSISSAAPCLSDSSTCREPSCRRRPWSKRANHSHLMWLHILFHHLSALNPSCQKELHWIADASSYSDLIIIQIRRCVVVFRALLLGLASNLNVKDVSLDLSCCEVSLAHLHFRFSKVFVLFLINM